MMAEWEKHADDGLRSFTLACEVRREENVRLGIFEPRDEREERQAKEGPVPRHLLDCMRRQQEKGQQ